MHTLKAAHIFLVFSATLCFYLDYVQCKTIVKREAAGAMYDTKYDNVDVNSIVQSRRLMLNYVNCLLDRGPCTPDAQLLRTYLPDALQTDCAKCSAKQKEISGILMGNLIQFYNDLYVELLAKYDPDGVFRKKLEGDGTDPEDDEEDD